MQKSEVSGQMSDGAETFSTSGQWRGAFDARATDDAVPRGVAESAPIRHFTDLIVWQKSFQLGVSIWKSSKCWPPEERYALTDQVRRSARAIGANVAAAWGKRRYEAAFIAKLSDADAEAHETEHWLLNAREHGSLDAELFRQLKQQLDEIGRILGSIMRRPAPFLLHSHRDTDL